MTRLPLIAATRSFGLSAEQRFLATLTLATAIAAFAPMAHAQSDAAPAPKPEATAEQPADTQPADAAADSATDASAEAPATSPADNASAEPPPEAPASDAATDSAAASMDTPMAEFTAGGGPDSGIVGATIRDTEGNTVGAVSMRDTPSGIMLVHLTLMGMEPGVRAVHIHETGACEGDFSSAGGHLAGGREHGVLTEGGPHAGDLPNVIIPEGGKFESEFFASGVTLADIMDDDGGAIIVHNGTDDYQSQPSGNAGDRIACGVLGGE